MNSKIVFSMLVSLCLICCSCQNARDAQKDISSESLTSELLITEEATTNMVATDPATSDSAATNQDTTALTTTELVNSTINKSEEGNIPFLIYTRDPSEDIITKLGYWDVNASNISIGKDLYKASSDWTPPLY